MEPFRKHLLHYMRMAGQCYAAAQSFKFENLRLKALNYCAHIPFPADDRRKQIQG